MYQPTPVFLPGKFHRQRSMAGYSPWGCRVGHDWACPHVNLEILSDLEETGFLLLTWAECHGCDFLSQWGGIHFAVLRKHQGQLCYYFLRFFLMWTIFKVFIKFVTILLLVCVLHLWPWEDLSSPTRDQTCTPAVGRQSLNPWMARRVLRAVIDVSHEV